MKLKPIRLSRGRGRVGSYNTPAIFPRRRAMSRCGGVSCTVQDAINSLKCGTWRMLCRLRLLRFEKQHFSFDNSIRKIKSANRLVRRGHIMDWAGLFVAVGWRPQSRWFLCLDCQLHRHACCCCFSHQLFGCSSGPRCTNTLGGCV